MRNVLAAALMLLVSLNARADELPAKVDWPLKKIYIPVGFDDNDNVQIVVAGAFPNSCYQMGPTEVKRSGDTIEIRQVAYVEGILCLQVLNPFFKTIDLGRMTRGRYRVVDGSSHARLGELSVEKATVVPGPDDAPYAPVQDAMVGKNRDGSRTLMLVGMYTDRCMKLASAPVMHYYPDVLVVQPIVEVGKGPDCGPAKIPFQEFYPVRDDAPANFLLHVRTMNGLAINRPVGDLY